MIVRSFTGRNVSEALEKVRRDFGEHALIIETRSVKEPGLLGRKVGVEVVAASDADPQQAPAPAVAVAAGWEPPAQHQERHRRPAPASQQAQLLAAARERVTATVPAVSDETLHDLMTPQPGLSLELASIRRQLARLASGQGVPTGNLGENLCSRLEAGELPDEIIAECDEALGKARDRIDPTRTEEFLILYLARHLPLPGAIDWQRCRSLLMVGPTGVGKTTTLAKLAGELVLNRRRTVGLVTIDTYRVGAADQLQAYADLLDMPFAVARTPAEMGAVLQHMEGCDHILIDTAGRSPNDGARLHELRGFCRATPGVRVMLAVAAVGGRAEFASVVERFSILPIEHCVVTKVDEAVAVGRLYGCLRRHALPVNYVTNGQEVPSDIAPAAAREITARILAGPAGAATPCPPTAVDEAR